MDKLVLYGIAVVFIIGIIIFGLWLFPYAWNYVMPYLFNLPKIDWKQGLALCFVFSCLFKSFSYKGKD